VCATRFRAANRANTQVRGKVAACVKACDDARFCCFLNALNMKLTKLHSLVGLAALLLATGCTGSVIDGRPRFAKPSLDVGKQVEIAAIDPDCDRGRSLCP